MHKQLNKNKPITKTKIKNNKNMKIIKRVFEKDDGPVLQPKLDQHFCTKSKRDLQEKPR